MKLDKNTIKAVLAMELQKRGSDLTECEEYLKEASMTKEGSIEPTSMLRNLLMLGGASAAAAGGALGLGGYMGYKANDDSNERIQDRLRTKAQYEEALRALQNAQQNNFR